MSDIQVDPFDIFDDAILEEKRERQIVDKKCNHLNVFQCGQNTTCTDCSEILCNISKQKEWFNCNNESTSRNQTRCHQITKIDKNIYGDVEGMDFPSPIIFEANNMYLAITEGKTHRANNRKAIIFGCIFRAYKYSDDPKSLEQLQAVFPLTEKVISKGMKVVGLNIHKYKKNIPTYITASNLIPEIMCKFNAKREHINDVLKLYAMIKNKSSIINRSRPQSIAISLIYYYIRETGRNISIEEFIQKVNLSEPTITKIIKEIEKIMKK